MLGNKNASKKLLRIEMRWWHNEKSVRATKGGKPRKIKVAKSTTTEELLEIAKSLFFPAGLSARGLQASTCTFEMKDFCHNVMSAKKTVKQVYME